VEVVAEAVTVVEEVAAVMVAEVTEVEVTPTVEAEVDMEAEVEVVAVVIITPTVAVVSLVVTEAVVTAGVVIPEVAELGATEVVVGTTTKIRAMVGNTPESKPATGAGAGPGATQPTERSFKKAEHPCTAFYLTF